MEDADTVAADTPEAKPDITVFSASETRTPTEAAGMLARGMGARLPAKRQMNLTTKTALTH